MTIVTDSERDVIEVVTPGPQGPQGDFGGPQGFQGATGAAGAQGVQGAQGDVGVAGPQGAQGDVGVAGPQGTTGSAGAQGVQGTQGVAGVAGPQGAQGDSGPAGAQGVQGTQGIAGPQGATGVQGTQGIAGPQGATGSQGATGAQGFQGASGGGGTVAPNIVAAGNLGASRSQPIDITQETWVIGTLNAAAHTFTVTGLTAGNAGAKMKVFLTEDATGGRTFTVSDGGGSQGMAINTAANAPSVVYITWDGVDLYATVVGVGPQGAQGAAGAAGAQGAAGAAGAQGVQGADGSNGAISQVQDEGSDLAVRGKLNFLGAGVTATDNAGNGSTDITIPGGGGGGLTDNSVKSRHMTAPYRSAAGWLPTGWISANMRRSTARERTASTPIVAGTLMLVGDLVLPGGVAVNNITFLTGSVGFSSPTHQWFCLVDQSGNVLGKTADDTTNAWGVDTPKTLALTAPYTPSDDQPVYVGLAYTGGTPAQMAGSLVGRAVLSLAPALMATGGTITDPASIGATVTITPNSTTAPCVPYCGVS